MATIKKPGAKKAQFGKSLFSRIFGGSKSSKSSAPAASMKATSTAPATNPRRGFTSDTQPVDSNGEVTVGMANPYKNNPNPKSLSVGFKNGGKVVKKAKDGKSFPDLNKDGKVTKADVLKGRGVIAKKGAVIKKAQNGYEANSYTEAKMKNIKGKVLERSIEKAGKEKADSITKGNLDRAKKILKTYKPVSKMKAGGMIKRKDGSISQRGLWDNIRANKGSGKKPTAAMLKQEKKIKAKK